MSKKIMSHIDKDEIIKRLSDGESIRSVSKWLSEKHPNNKKLWISTVSLQSFRKKNLQLKGKVLKDIQEAAEVTKRGIEIQQRQAQLENTNAYQDKINEIANTHVDVSRRLLQLDKIIGDRMEYWFNAISNGEESVAAADKQLQQYMDRQMSMLQNYKKLVEGMADHTVEHNINVTVMNDQISIIRDVIRDVMGSISPEHALLFMDKLASKLEGTEYSIDTAADISVGIDSEALNVIEAKVLSEYEGE